MFRSFVFRTFVFVSDFDIIFFVLLPLSRCLIGLEGVGELKSLPFSESVRRPSLPEFAPPPKGAILPFSNRMGLVR